jgi:plasmid stabilization system protein ParE
MSYGLRILPAADADVDDIADYITRDSTDASLRFLDSVDETYRQISEHPERWPRYELDPIHAWSAFVSERWLDSTTTWSSTALTPIW